jgi:hypothetical protein
MDKNRIAYQSTYGIGDIVEYDNRNFLVTQIVDGPYMATYKMLRIGTSIVYAWFAVDIDLNSRLVA